MTDKEQEALFGGQLFSIYSGILCNNREFAGDVQGEIVYKFDCPEYETLVKKYGLKRIAGKGTSFERAKRLLHYLAPRLTHSSWYDNHVPCNALDLLEYSLNNKEQGINCLNKSKIFEECCLALGIYSRRVAIMPYSPYDFDNHVVCEIYDEAMDKWIMMDPTTDGMFVDGSGMPLSLLEMRQKFADDEFVTFVKSKDKLADVQKLKEKYLDQNVYICKNLFYFTIEKEHGFGERGGSYIFAPIGYSIKEKSIANIKYRINHMPKEYTSWIDRYKKMLENTSPEPEKTDISAMLKSPI